MADPAALLEKLRPLHAGPGMEAVMPLLLAGLIGAALALLLWPVLAGRGRVRREALAALAGSRRDDSGEWLLGQAAVLRSVAERLDESRAIRPNLWRRALLPIFHGEKVVPLRRMRGRSDFVLLRNSANNGTASRPSSALWAPSPREGRGEGIAPKGLSLPVALHLTRSAPASTVWPARLDHHLATTFFTQGEGRWFGEGLYRPGTLPDPGTMEQSLQKLFAGIKR